MLAVLILSGFTSCQFFKKDPTPFTIDTDLMETREYEMVQRDPPVFRYKMYHPIKRANGFICVPPDQVDFVSEGQSNGSNE